MAICDTLVVTRDLLRLEEVIGENTAQTIVSQVVDIPAEKPGVRSVIDHTETTTVTKTTIVPGKVIVEGTIRLTIVYESTLPDQSVHVAHFTIPFTVFVEVSGAQPDNTVFTTLTIEDVTFEVLSDGRQLRVRVIIQLFAKVVQSSQVSVVVDVTGVAGLAVTKETIRAEDILAEANNQLVLRDTLTIPEEKPPAASVIDFSATATVDKTTIIDNKVIVSGVVNIRIIYEAAEPAQSVHVVHFTLRFEGFVDTPCARPGMTVSTSVEVEFASFDVASGGRNITARIILDIKVRVIRVRAITIVTHVVGPPEIQVRKELVRIQEVLAERIGQSIVQEILDIPPEKPPVASVLEHSETVTITRTIVATGKVIVEGTVSLRVVYEAANEQQTVNVVHFEVNFSDFVVLPEAHAGMSVTVTGKVEFVSFDVQPPGDPITAQIVLSLTARLVRTRQIHIVVDVFCGPPAPCLVTVTADRVNVRTGPGLQFDIITTLPKGATAGFVAIVGDWTRIVLANGVVGFVLSVFIFNPCRPLG